MRSSSILINCVSSSKFDFRNSPSGIGYGLNSQDKIWDEGYDSELQVTWSFLTAMSNLVCTILHLIWSSMTYQVSMSWTINLYFLSSSSLTTISYQNMDECYNLNAAGEQCILYSKLYVELISICVNVADALELELQDAQSVAASKQLVTMLNVIFWNILNYYL